MTLTSHNDGHDWDVGGSSVRHISTATHSDKRPVRLPMDHFKRLVEEACPNNAYPIRHNIKDYGMMRSFMTSGSLTWGAKLHKGPYGIDTMPFSDENAVMTAYGGHPLSRRRRVSSLSPKAPTHYGWGHGGSGV
jgi:hypothetical protein